MKRIAEFNQKDFKTLIGSDAAEAYKLLSIFADYGISLLAFKAIPIEGCRTQFYCSQMTVQR